jgi:hypothetical protein
MLNLMEIREKWQPCPACDYGLIPQFSCICPQDDPRRVIELLVREVAELRQVCRDVRHVAEREVVKSQAVSDILRLVAPGHCGVDGYRVE